jgi:chromosome segregation ATPase
MSSNLRPMLQRGLNVNSWILVIAFLLPIGIGATYFIQEHRYKTEKTEKVVLQEELSKAKDSLQNAENQISKDNTQIEKANSEVKSLTIRLEISNKEIQDLRKKFTSANNTVKTLKTQKLAFTQCIRGVEHIVETTNPLYRRIQENRLKSWATSVDALTAASAFSELHSVWDAADCQTSQQLLLTQIDE